MDIKISLEIGLSPALEGFLGKFLNPARVEADEHRQAFDQPHHGHVEEEAAREESPQPQRRTRRTKAEMEAANSGVTQSSSPRSESTSGSQAEPQTDTGSSDTSTDGPSDLAAALGIEADGDLTEKDVKDKITEVVNHTRNVKLVQDTMLAASGFKSTKDMPAEKYGAVIDALDKLLAA